MKRVLATLTVTITTVMAIAPVRAAAEPQRVEVYGRIFDRLLDANGNGTLDKEEIPKMPAAFQQWMTRENIDFESQPVTRTSFIEFAPRLFAALQERTDRSVPTPTATPSVGRRNNADLVPRVDPQAVAEGKAIDPAKLSNRRNSARNLPGSYQQLDLNADGQIALSEWIGKTTADFLKLDENADGFLTPRELGVKSRSSSRSSYRSSSSFSSSSSPSSSGSSSNGGVSPDVARRAEYIFKALDKDKDGKLSEAEWNGSRSTRDRFQKANVSVRPNVDLAGFQQAYQEVYNASRGGSGRR